MATTRLYYSGGGHLAGYADGSDLGTYLLDGSGSVVTQLSTGGNGSDVRYSMSGEILSQSGPNTSRGWMADQGYLQIIGTDGPLGNMGFYPPPWISGVIWDPTWGRPSQNLPPLPQIQPGLSAGDLWSIVRGLLQPPIFSIIIRVPPIPQPPALPPGNYPMPPVYVPPPWPKRPPGGYRNPDEQPCGPLPGPNPAGRRGVAWLKFVGCTVTCTLKSLAGLSPVKLMPDEAFEIEGKPCKAGEVKLNPFEGAGIVGEGVDDELFPGEREFLEEARKRLEPFERGKCLAEGIGCLAECFCQLMLDLKGAGDIVPWQNCGIHCEAGECQDCCLDLRARGAIDGHAADLCAQQCEGGRQ